MARNKSRKHDYSFFFNDTATTEIYTLSLHDALPISASRATRATRASARPVPLECSGLGVAGGDRKSTRLNSSHQISSYAVFCLTKKRIQPIVATQLMMAAGRRIAQVISQEMILYPDVSPAYLPIGGGYLLVVFF